MIITLDRLSFACATLWAAQDCLFSAITSKDFMFGQSWPWWLAAAMWVFMLWPLFTKKDL